VVVYTHRRHIDATVTSPIATINNALNAADRSQGSSADTQARSIIFIIITAMVVRERRGAGRDDRFIPILLTIIVPYA